jgi:cold shock CspA family protein
MEISRSVLIVMALSMVAVLSFRIGHLLWSRMQFKSRIFWIETSGTFQTSQISVGNQLRGSALSNSTLTRVQDATLRVWVTDIVSVVFGKDGKRSIIAMASADSVAKGIANRLIDFAAEQSAVATPSSDRDLARAASIGTLDAAVRTATKAATSGRMAEAIGRVPEEAQGYLSVDTRIEGRVKFYDAAKAYGYIVAVSGEQYFFNANGFRGDAPRKGDRVEFSGERGRRGLIAKRLLVSASA